MSTETTAHTDLTIRLLDGSDQPALRRLAERDGAAIPDLPLGAFLGHELIAALSLSDPDARPVADPFARTSAAVALLRMRADQLHAAQGGDRDGGWRNRLRLPRSPRARGAIAGSRPGGGSRLLQL